MNINCAVTQSFCSAMSDCLFFSAGKKINEMGKATNNYFGGGGYMTPR
jgi:hypothetical protein